MKEYNTFGLKAKLSAVCFLDFAAWAASTEHPGMSYLVGDWSLAWGIFAAFAFVTAVAFCFFFKDKK